MQSKKQAGVRVGKFNLSADRGNGFYLEPAARGETEKDGGGGEEWETLFYHHSAKPETSY